ncbi:hypothetical protein HBA55_24680 [Pseudomaricurvus alkylphenolicus]|jgi:hypothetical protein|uniref:porin n=1 Tax=Pseudomaricurvus alkylphenolicus TaxID=1306991 RepID=UPI00141FFB5E|nr:porin [Pseudomaricurvus alkylphenolicus]NIB42826.1 hypothetical protein [Pseudomaricurvus alkylphenolicus]
MSKQENGIIRSKNPIRLAVAAAALAMGGLSAPVLAGGKVAIDDTKWLSVGAGFRAQYDSVEDGANGGEDRSNEFTMSNMRLYLSGQLHEMIKFTFNTEKLDGEDIEVLDAVAQFELSPAFNIWVGRMLTPADRIEMSGPFYALSWNQYRQPLYASDQGGEAGRIGRDEGITLWGSMGKFQYAIGAFDGLEGGANQSDELLYAGRFAYNFLNKEDNPGYYTSSTYYGSLGNIFTLGASFQSQSDGVGSEGEAGDFTGYTLDLLSETVLDGGGVVTVEAEYKDFDADYTLATTPTSGDCFCLFDGDSWFATAAYLFPAEVGPGKFQPYVRFVENNPSDADSSDATEFGLNYVISGHNARLNINFVDGDANASGYAGADVNSFTVGVQVQL